MRKIIFDLDDTLWPLNKRVCEILNISLSKFNTYDIRDSTQLTTEEINSVYSWYSNPNPWKNIEYYKGIHRLLDLEKYNAKVYINSNCLNKDIADFKRGF